MEAIQIVIKHVQPRFTRPYKGGVEPRGINIDHAREQINQLIKKESLPIEIIDTDVAVRSISIRAIRA